MISFLVLSSLVTSPTPGTYREPTTENNYLKNNDTFIHKITSLSISTNRVGTKIPAKASLQYNFNDVKMVNLHQDVCFIERNHILCGGVVSLWWHLLSLWWGEGLEVVFLHYNHYQCWSTTSDRRVLLNMGDKVMIRDYRKGLKSWILILGIVIK